VRAAQRRLVGPLGCSVAAVYRLRRLSPRLQPHCFQRRPLARGFPRTRLIIVLSVEFSLAVCWLSDAVPSCRTLENGSSLQSVAALRRIPSQASSRYGRYDFQTDRDISYREARWAV